MMPTNEAAGSWAHLVGLLIAVVIAVLAISLHQWWDERYGPSPTPPHDDDIDVTPGETYELTPDDTDDDTTPDTGWWGRRIRMPDGSIVVRQPHALDVVEDDDEIDIDIDIEDEETREEMADRLVREGGSYADWVREIMGAFDVSEATAKRAIREARERVDA